MEKSHFQLRIGKTESVRAASGIETAATAAKPCVLMVGMHLTKTRGGISTLIAEILNSPLRDDFEFVYVASQAEDFGKFGKAFLAIAAVARFIVICLRKRPSAVYVHLGSNASLYRESIFIFLAKLLRKKTVAHFHAGDINHYYPFQTKIGQKFISSALGSADCLIAVSEESAGQLRAIAGSSGRKNVSVIANAIDTSVFDAGERESKYDADAALRLLFVGAIGKLKGERDLIKALAIVRERRPRLRLKVSFLGYGAESLQPACEKLGVADFVEHLGAVSMSERLAFFQKADIFVLPTYAEAMPMSVIEAMAAGLAVVTTSVGGIPELVEDGADGLLFAPGEVEDLAGKILVLLENRDLRLNLGRKARRKARAQMDFRQYAEKLRSRLRAACTK